MLRCVANFATLAGKGLYIGLSYLGMAGQTYRHSRPARSRGAVLIAALLVAVACVAFYVLRSSRWLHHPLSRSQGDLDARALSTRAANSAHIGHVHMHADLRTSSADVVKQADETLLDSFEPTDASLRDIAAATPAMLAATRSSSVAAGSATFMRQAERSRMCLIPTHTQPCTCSQH